VTDPLANPWGFLDHASYLGPLGLVGLISWTVWLTRWVLSRLYRPVISSFRASTSVVVPVYREDPDVLMRCLGTWLAQEPDELLLVVDTGDEENLRRLKRIRTKRLKVIAFAHSGKRSALGVGIRAATKDIVVLADSDTSWEPGLLANVQMPFEDPRVGGVGTRQNVYMRTSSIWRIVADWMVSVRYLDFVPAMGRAGGVACLSGRTAAYRRSILLDVLPELEHEVFLGRQCLAGDDGRLTWLVLSRGYKTVYQGTARATSMFPDSFRAFVKQRVRWSRNSYRCYFTAIYKRWLWHQPLVTQVTVMQILLTPLSMTGALVYLVGSVASGHWPLVLLSLGWLLGGRAIRGISHLREQPRDIVYLPLIVAATVLVALPIKAYAFVTMNRHGWLTRAADHVGAEAQSEASLYRTAEAPSGGS
jgi:cellulose synthase/poly-beta-1,6-N-acetylglucosamine synthase-like glycosyltransferase